MTSPGSVPVFPYLDKGFDGQPLQHPGITLREYAAVHILAGYCADRRFKGSPDDKAQWALADADAMMRQLGYTE